MSTIGNYILACIYFMLPAYIANMMPVFAKNINILAYPVDFNRHCRGKIILGDHKTFRGLLSGIIGGALTAYLQYLLFNINAPFFRSISLINYSNWLIFGSLMGFGALAGDMAKSFFKRQAGIAPGAPFIPYDQLDFVAGAIIFAAPVYLLPLGKSILILLLSFALHITVRHIGYYIGINDVKW